MSTKYNWSPDADIIMKGRDFEIIYNSLQIFLSGQTTSIPNIVNLTTALASANITMQANVESGIITAESPTT